MENVEIGIDPEIILSAISIEDIIKFYTPGELLEAIGDEKIIELSDIDLLFDIIGYDKIDQYMRDYHESR